MRFIAILTFVLCLTVTSYGQRQVVDTFTVAIVPKTPAHPYFGIGHEMGYSINGIEGATIYLIRDSTYALHHDTLRGDEIPLFFTKPIGGTTDKYFELRSGEDRPGHIIFMRTRPDAPDTLYYASSKYPWMGGTFILVDSLPSSVPHESVPGSGKSLIYSMMTPHPVRSAANLSFEIEKAMTCRLQVVDLHGRIVSETTPRTLPSGTATIPFDRTGLPTGTYFYRVVTTESNHQPITMGTFQVR